MQRLIRITLVFFFMLWISIPIASADLDPNFGNDIEQKIERSHQEFEQQVARDQQEFEQRSNEMNWF